MYIYKYAQYFFFMPCNMHTLTINSIEMEKKLVKADNPFGYLSKTLMHFKSIISKQVHCHDRHSEITLFVTTLPISMLSNTCNTCSSKKPLYHFIKTAHTLSLETISSNRLCPNQELRTPNLADIVY